mgnify:CR=1 FL=1
MNRFNVAYTGFTLLGKVIHGIGKQLRSPVFIIGTGRCGTTLLVDMLKTHTQLAGFPSEANELWHPKSHPFEKRSIETPPITENPKQFTKLSIENWPTNHEQTIKQAFQGFFNIRAKSKLFFSKSAMTAFMVPKIKEIFPDALFIHLFRNGTSVVESLVKKECHRFIDRYSDKSVFEANCAQYWNDCILEIEKQKETYLNSDNYMEFSYERLCEQPRTILQDISAFINVDAQGFTYDLSSVSSTNYKVGESMSSATEAKLLDIMKPAMKLKGYLN